MIKFNCDKCSKLIEDICGEHVDTDSDGNIIRYKCPHCGKIVDVNNFTGRLLNYLSSITDDELDKILGDYSYKDGFPLAKDYIDYIESNLENKN